MSATDTAALAATRPTVPVFAPRKTILDHRPDGTMMLRSPIELIEPTWSITDFLPYWAEKAPDRAFIAERVGSNWKSISFGEMWQRVQAVAHSLIANGARPLDRMAILSGNSIDHATIMFAAMKAGVVVSPISPNYSLMPGGLSRLKDIVEILSPSFVFVQSAATFAGARTIPKLGDALWISGDDHADCIPLDRLADAAFDAGRELPQIDREAPAKILFTSGSTGLPKGVINTHRMMACALEMGQLLAPVPEAPVQVEWLPWHHTMGGNVILQGILRRGGTLYIDDGRPVPQLFHKTIANLKDVSPTAMFNVPAGYTLLCEALQTDAELRRSFFARLERISYAGAAISRDTLEQLYELGSAETGRRIPVMSGYGTTETAPTISTTHWATEEPGEIGLPGPGLLLKLVPVGDALEVRVRGPNVTPGYLGRKDLTESAFDEEGFYRIGDTVAFLDPARPDRGLCFKGRLSENFKLTNGTWVSVARVRAEILAATKGVLQDVVVAGENREHCSLLAWLNPVRAGSVAAKPTGALDADPDVIDFLRHSVHAYNATVGGSECIHAIILMRDPPSLAAGETTDKGYVNQRAVLKSRAALVEKLYAPVSDTDLVVIQTRH